jgi:hypothetical protein
VPFHQKQNIEITKMESHNHQIAHEILHSYQRNKEAADLYQRGFVKAANSKLQHCEMHIHTAFELIAKAMQDPSMCRSIITLENSRKKISTMRTGAQVVVMD